MRKNKAIFKLLKITDAHFLAEYAAACDGITNNSEINKIETRLKQRFKNRNYLGTVALAGNRPIGFQDGLINNDVLELNEIYVMPQNQGKGAGKKLVEKIIVIAKAKGVKRISLYTKPNNEVMQKLAKKLNFRLTRVFYEKVLIKRKY